MDDITTPKQENTNRKQEKPKWIVNLENNIDRIRTKIAHVHVIINCKKKGKFTKLTLLKQDLRSKFEKLKQEKSM